MLISKIPDNDAGKGESVPVQEEEGDSNEYQTANELFELMAKNQNFDTTDVEKLTTRDLVLLYKNIDLGTKLMSNTNELQRQKPNQHVESVVYNDESDSDISERYSSEDLRSVFLLNSERLDLLTAPSSAENTLCHKLGNLQMQTSSLTAEYDNRYLFNDPYIKEQLKNLKSMNKSTDIEKAVLPVSLLDYVCCKRLEDNYNFYMDNIIGYVKKTIDQLKSISNGDYLTDKAKEKWREVETTTEDLRANTKVLATSTSIPLHVERKISGRNTKWDDLVHSAVDIRSLSKILEKRIVVELPKLLCGPYKLLSKCCAKNVIISCQKEKRPVEERVDVVVQLQRSETGEVISNINSIMILQSAPVEGGNNFKSIIKDILEPEVLPLPLTYIEPTNDDIPSPKTKSKIVEFEPLTIAKSVHQVSINTEGSMFSSENAIEDSLIGSIDYGCSDNDVTGSLKNSSCQESSDAGDGLKDILDTEYTILQKEASSEVFRDDLSMTMRKLTMQSALKEESGDEMSHSPSKKKKSLTRVRIKSPYENQSYILEEKKRRKLLEIRERRERKKMALVENCKITKHKYAKGTTFPQSASSVTKLSISNKSFYNSIYGQATNAVSSKQVKGRNRKGGNRDVLEIDMNDNNEGDEHDESGVSTPDKNSKKYINRSYYLDDADTEMMYTNMKRNENDAKDFASTSTSETNDFGNNLKFLSQLISPFETDLNIGDDEIFPDKVKLFGATIIDDVNDERTSKESRTTQSIIKVPLNSPNKNEQDNTESKKATSSVECRKSIEKLYTLINKLGKVHETENKLTKSKAVASTSKKIDEKDGRMSSMCLGSESGTSLNHRMPSSNPSSFASFDKNNTEKPNNSHNKKPGSLLPVVSKVVISSKSSLIPKTDLENNRKNCKRSSTNLSIKVPENPLKAISQLLHEFENVQKTRRKHATDAEQKHQKIEMAPNDGISELRKNSAKRRSRFDKHNDSQIDRHVRLSTPKEKKSRQHKEMDLPKTPYQQIPDDKHTDRLPRKKIIEMLDEAKEARGEAVRGPSKLTSRLNSLAQPKRTYVQAHSEEYQTKYGRTLMADRLQRLAAAPPQTLDTPSGSANTRNRLKRSGSEAVPAIRALKAPRSPPSPVPPPERAFRTLHSPNSIPEAKERQGNQVMASSHKQVSVQETPPILKKKMVAVESYVKNHYGRISPNSQNAQKLRVPLLPSDIDIASSTSSAPFQESTELGSRLHNIISSIMKTTNSQGLEVLTECQESTSHTENRSSTGRSSSGSDYALDVLNDNNVITSVENTDKASENKQKQPSFKKTGAIQIDLQPDRCFAESERLESALCSHISVGTFQKRLRIKNLNMTPKQSMQQVFVLESGDAGSLVVQKPITTTINENTSGCFSELSAIPILSKPHIDWRFGNFPMQISTVGYALADYKSTQRSCHSLIQLFDKVSKKPEEEMLLLSTTHKSNGDNSKEPMLHTEQAAQVDFLDATTLVTVEISTSCTIIESDKNEKMELAASNAEPKSVFIDFSQNNEVQDTLKGRETETHTVTENKKKVSEADKPENIEYSTSLDILVGLLNEIQNITTCQTQITKGDKEKSPSEIQQSKVLETILINEAANAMGNSMKSSRCDVVSFTSLDRLRQLESNPSLYSFYLSDNEGSEKSASKLNFPSKIIPNYTNELNELWCPKTIYVDKEVGVDFIDRGAVSKLRDAPSKVPSITMTNSLVKVLSKTSIQSMVFAECPPVDSNAALVDKKSIQNMPQILITSDTKQSLDFYDVINETIEKPENKPRKLTIRVKSLEKKKIKNMTKTVNNCQFSFKTDFDPIMKMKRDILVTVYSILVFTVFAALSFPEMLYRI